MNTALVIGGNSRLGRAVSRQLKIDGWRVFETTRQRTCLNETTVYLDLDNVFNADHLPDAKVCLIAAANTSIEFCERDPSATHKINVEAVLQLAATLAKKGCYTLFLSTNQVFSGESPFTCDSEQTQPKTVYGQQKAEAERGVLEVGLKTAVLRLSKVIDPMPKLFIKWHQKMSKNMPVEAFSDMVFSPIPQTFVVDLICTLLKTKRNGIFQMSGDEDISYLSVAYKLAKKIDADKSLIKATKASDSSLGFIPPKNTTLDITRLKTAFGIVAPVSQVAIDESLDMIVRSD